jgi:hypothetical protein
MRCSKLPYDDGEDRHEIGKELLAAAGIAVAIQRNGRKLLRKAVASYERADDPKPELLFNIRYFSGRDPGNWHVRRILGRFEESPRCFWAQRIDENDAHILYYDLCGDAKVANPN